MLINIENDIEIDIDAIAIDFISKKDERKKNILRRNKRIVHHFRTRMCFFLLI